METEHYLFKFRILVSDIFVAGCPNGTIHLLWKTPTAMYLYDQFELKSLKGHISVNNDLEIEETLTRFTNERIIMKTQLLVMNIVNDIKRPMASIKIDLASLAESQILNCVKKFEMSSFLEEQAWISFSISQLYSMKVSREEVIDFGYIQQNNTMQKGIRQVISHMNTLNNEQDQSVSNHRKKEGKNQRLMKLLQGKNDLISNYQQKIQYLIQVIKSKKNTKKLDTDRRSQSSTKNYRNTARTLSTGSQTDKKSVKIQPSSSIVDINNTQNNYLKQRLQQAKMKQLQLKSRIFELQKQITESKKPNKINVQQQLKQYRDALYNEKKNNILLRQQNERLTEKCYRIVESREVTEKRPYSSRNASYESPKSHKSILSRKISEFFIEKMDDDGKWKVPELEAQIVSLKQQIIILKRRLTSNQQHAERMFERQAIGLQQKTRLKIQEYKNKLFQEAQRHSEQMSKLQKQHEHIKIQSIALARQKSYLEKQVQMLKSLHQRNQQKKLLTDSSIIRNEKYKRRCIQLEQMNRKLQNKIQKQEEQIKKKKSTIIEITQKMNQKQAELNRLQRLQGDFQKQMQKLVNLQNNQPNIRKLNFQLNSLQHKKISIQQKVKNLSFQLKQWRQNLDKMIQNDQISSTTQIQKQIKKRQQLLKTRQQQLQSVQSQLFKRTSQIMASQYLNKIQFLTIKLQQITQQNQQLKLRIRDFVKRSSVTINEIDPKDNLIDVQIRQKQLNVKEQEFNCEIQQMIIEYENADTVKMFKEYIVKSKQMYGQRLRQLKEQITKIYHRQLDLCLRQKRVTTSQNRSQIMQILRKVLSLLQQNSGSNRRAQDRSRQQQFIRKQKQNQTKLKEQKQKIRLSVQKRKHESSISDIQSKYRNQKIALKNQIKQYHQKLKVLSQKQRQIRELSKKIDKLSEQNKQIRNECARYKSGVQTLKTKTDDMNQKIIQLEKTNEFYQTKNRSLMESMKDLQNKLLKTENDGIELAQQLQQLIQNSKNKNDQWASIYQDLQSKYMKQKQQSTKQIQRLKRIVEQSVVRQISSDDQKQDHQNQIQYLRSTIQQISSQLKRKQSMLSNLRQQINYQIQKQKICDQQYATVLQQYQTQCKKYIQLKAQYIQMQILNSKAWDSINELQDKIRDQQAIFERKIDDKKQKIDELNSAINETMRGNIQRDLEYRLSITDYEVCIKKMEVEKENNNKIMQEMVKDQAANLQQFNRRCHQMTETINMLNKELKQYEKDKNDPKRKTRKLISPDGKGLNTSRMTPMNKTKLSIMPSEINRSRIYSSNDRQMDYLLPNPRGQQTNQLINSHASSSSIQPNSPKFNQSPYSSPNSQNQQIQFKLNVYDAQNNKGQQYQLSSPTKLRKIQFPQTQMQKAQNTEQNQNQLHSQVDQTDSKYQQQQQLQQQINQYKSQIQRIKIQLDQKQSIIIQSQRNVQSKQSQLDEIKRFIQISINKRQQRVQYQQLQNLECYFDFQTRQQIGGIYIEQFKDIWKNTRQLNYIEEKFLKNINKMETYEVSIQQMNKQIQSLTNSNNKLVEQLRALEQSKDKTIQQINIQLNGKKVLIESYEVTLEGHSRERQHSNKIISDLQYQNNKLTQVIRNIEDTIQNMSEEIRAKKQFMEQIVEQKTALEEQIQQCNIDHNTKVLQLNSKIYQLQQSLDNKQKQLSSLQHQFQQRGKAIQQLQIQQQNYLKQIQQLGQKLISFDEKFSQRNKRFQQLLIQSSTLTNTNALLQLKTKQTTQSKNLSQLKYTEQLKQQKQTIKTLEQQIINLKRQISQSEQIKKKLQYLVSDKDHNIEALKSDIVVFQNQIVDINSSCGDWIKDNQEKQMRFKKSLEIGQIQIQQLKSQVIGLKQDVQKGKQRNEEYKQTVDELNKMERIREQAMKTLENKHKQIVQQLQQELRKTKLQTSNKLAIQKKQIVQQSNSKFQSILLQLQQSKNQLKQYRKQVQIQRLQMFSKQRQFQDTKADYQQQRQSFMSKIQRYQQQVSIIADKLKDYEHNRPAVQLYQQIIFQNQIFKNRISQLQQNMVFNKDFSINQQVQFQRMKREQDKQEFMVQIQQYSKQIAQLEQKNYELEVQLQERGYLVELEEENQRLQKEIARLQHSEQQLKMEVNLLRNKREEEIRRMSLEIRQLKQK